MSVKTNENIILDFIEKNKLNLNGSQGNSDFCTLIGYTQWHHIFKSELLEICEKSIKSSILNDEIERLWDYCINNNYAHWWNIESNRNLWTIDEQRTK
jgi:hypothetical protein